MGELIKYIDVCKSFGEKQILKNVNLTFDENKIIGVVGKNGSGKTTLFKLANDLLVPSSGEVLIDGKKVGVETKKLVAFLPERTYLDKNIKVENAIEMFADFYDNFDKQKAEKLLTDLKLDKNMKLSKMSKGMKEKLQLVLVMSRHAKLYILDEPLGGVDPITRDYILDTILQNFDEGASLVISTHLISDIERILDEVVFVDDGKIILHESADELRQKHKASIDEIFRRGIYVKQVD